MADAEEKYLQEAVRLAELRLNDQIATNSQYERKAIVFITSSVAALVYLLGAVQISDSKFFAAALLCLAISPIFGVATVWTRQFGVPGLDPDDSWKCAPDAIDLLIKCLGIYQKKIEISGRVLRKKEITLKISICFFCAGAVLPVIPALPEIWRLFRPAV